VPEASGWFRDEIKSVDVFKGLKMRFFGLGASVMNKLGIEAQSMGLADTITALNTGTIDAAELGFPLQSPPNTHLLAFVQTRSFRVSSIPPMSTPISRVTGTLTNSRERVLSWCR